MKVFLGFVLLVLLGVQGAPVTQEDKSRLTQYHEQCLAKTGVEEDLVHQATRGTFSENSKLKDYLLCLSQKIGFIDENGELQKEVLKQKLGAYTYDTEAASRLVDKCAVQQKSPHDTAYHVIKCYYDSSPTHIVIYNDVLLSEEKTKKLIGHHRLCLNQTNVDEKLIYSAKKRGDFSQDPKFKEYILCLSKRIGFQNEEGKIQLEVVKQKVSEVTRDEKLAQALAEKCAIKQETPQETAYFMIKCYYDNTPSRIQLFPEKKTLRLPTEKVKLLVQYYKDCVAETGVDESLLKKVRKGNYSIDDQKVKEYAFCMSKKVGFLNEKGEIQREIVKKKMAYLIEDPEQQQKLLDLCAVQKESPQETAFHAMKCYYDESWAKVNVLEAVSISNEQREKYKAYCKACAFETGVRRELVNNAKKGQFSDDPTYKEYIFCLSKKVGYLGENGDIYRDVAKERLMEFLKDEDQVNTVLDKCLVKRDKPQDTAYETYKCVYENVPRRFYF